jgi:hypothetical protein
MLPRQLVWEKLFLSSVFREDMPGEWGSGSGQMPLAAGYRR